MKKLFLGLAVALVFTGCGKSKDPLVGYWVPRAVEHAGKRVELKDLVALAHIQGGARMATSRPFELTATGDYLSEGNRSSWRRDGEGSFIVTFRVHGKDVEATMQYQLEGKEMKVARPEGEVWLVLEKMEKKKEKMEDLEKKS